MIPTDHPLDGRTAIVTGASSGLGGRAAAVLHAAGATVVVAARRRERLEELREELGSRCEVVPCDVRDGADLDRLVAAAAATGRVDVLVNSVGVAGEEPAIDLEDERFAEIVEVNLTTVFALSKRFARVVRDGGNGGAIVNLSSILGEVATPHFRVAAYSASKAGLSHLTRALAAQWAPYGIRVNALAPGYFPSEMNAGVVAEGTESRRRIEERTLLGRLGRDGELDAPLLLLATDAGSYITGQVLAVDGGWTAV